MPEDPQNDYPWQMRSANEVARRCVVLYPVVAAGHGGPRGEFIGWLKREGLWDAVSPKEVAFLQSESPTQKQQADATWRVEALAPLLWSLRLLPELPPPTGYCDGKAMKRVLPPLMGSTVEWLALARLRPAEEIYDANEGIYQMHWAVRDARLNDKPVPNCYDAGVVQERHYALNWLIGYSGQDWDDVSTDT